MLYNVRFEVFTVVTMRMPSSRMLRHVALVRTNVLEECIASIIRMTRISELGTVLTVTSNGGCSVKPILYILVVLWYVL
jgi:hypothetical protein